MPDLTHPTILTHQLWGDYFKFLPVVLRVQHCWQVLLFFWWWCIDCSGTPSPTPASDGRCRLSGTCPLSASGLQKKSLGETFYCHFFSSFFFRSLGFLFFAFSHFFWHKKKTMKMHFCIFCSHIMFTTFSLQKWFVFAHHDCFCTFMPCGHTMLVFCLPKKGSF